MAHLKMRDLVSVFRNMQKGDFRKVSIIWSFCLDAKGRRKYKRSLQLSNKERIRAHSVTSGNALFAVLMLPSFNLIVLFH